MVSFAGPYRHIAALACTAALLLRGPDWFRVGAVAATISAEGLQFAINPIYLRFACLLAFIPLALAAMWLAGRFRDHPFGRRPVLVQHIMCVLLIGLAASHLLTGLPQAVLWGLIAVFAGYFWYLAYALIDQRSRQPSSLKFQLATFHPFFSLPETVVPMGKGAANWRGVEAGSEAELAVTQLKGLKLIAWANLLMLILLLFRQVAYTQLGVVPLATAFDRFLDDPEAPVRLGLASIVANFPEQLLLIAASGHAMIATARLAGFRLLRNTYRPLSSRTIAEFWNRYFYYFKEVLAHVYFYPAYVRWFKGHPELRLAFATFMAAGVGNFFMHFILNNNVIAALGLVGALKHAQTYAFYCAMLAAGIVISQLRARQPDPTAPWWRERLVPPLGVALFFCFLSFFDGPQRHVNLRLHFEFLYKVFGIDRWVHGLV